MTKAQLKEGGKIEKDQVKFIEGEFSPDNAREILGHLIQEKINYHNTKSFSNQVRFGSKDKQSETRIEELKQSQIIIRAIIEKAKEQGKTLTIKSNISIKVN